MLTSGELGRMMEADDLRGVTSNPTIFEKAIGGSTSYDEALGKLAKSGASAEEIYESLVAEDIGSAADVLLPVYEKTNGVDGYVSVEVSPTLAHDTAGTIESAKSLFALLHRPNVMIKIPATPEGLPAIEEVIASGINVNVTLIFSQDVYVKVAESYIRGLERRVESGEPVDRIASVASFFVSRIDVAVDSQLEKLIATSSNDEERRHLESLLGKAAIANAKLAYQKYKPIFGSERFARLKAQGAQVQRQLWASTGTKNPKYKDVIYVESLIGPDTVNTVPPETLKAFRDYGQVAPTLEKDVEAARETFEQLAAAGISLDDVTTQLTADGVKSFADSFTKLLALIEGRRDSATRNKATKEKGASPMSASRAVEGQAQFGVIGLAVMGANLALNIADHDFTVAVWTRQSAVTDKFIDDHNGPGRFTPAKTLEEFVGALERPRRIMMMIKAGAPVDEMISRLQPLLEAGDIIIDGGNSWFKDTQAREAALQATGINFIGSGVSGGEEGARFGPSLMPGGNLEAYNRVRPVFEAIAAKTDSGACVTYIGADGAGHFVKMVHNGIEYGDMQLIAEAYDVLRRAVGMRADELADTFAEWNRGPLESFLIEITAKIFTVKDEASGEPLVDLVLDKAGQKGTGKWTAQVALDLGVSIPTIAAAIDARVMSSIKDERVVASRELGDPAAAPGGIEKSDRQKLIAAVHDALYASKICSYAQGMNLIRAGSDEYGWNINLKEMARIWTGGCIIRARFLNDIMAAYERQPALPNLLLDDKFKRDVRAAQESWRFAVTTAQSLGIAVPAMAASLAYFDAYRTAKLPQNLTQAQRDLFGAHTYERTDQPTLGSIHTDWAHVSTNKG
jgi:6-phosphogluconate dehydrogenase